MREVEPLAGQFPEERRQQEQPPLMDRFHLRHLLYEIVVHQRLHTAPLVEQFQIIPLIGAPAGIAEIAHGR